MVVGSNADGYVQTQNTATVNGNSQTLAATGLNETYSYDSFGNLQSSGNYGFIQQYTSANRLLGWSYDAAGNLLYDGLGYPYQYDADSKIKSGAGVNYVYDAEGNRVEKSGSTLVDTIYFAGRPIARLAGGAWTDLIYGPRGLLAEVAGNQDGSPTYRMTDHLGSLIGTLSGAGAVLSTQDIAPFGELFTGGSPDPYVFTGKERDAESGNDYFGARYYSSAMGRFMSPDPILQNDLRLLNPQRWNKYSYAINNPLTLTDPTGKDAAYVNFSGMASGFGHGGILSIHPGSGSATYSRFGPMKAGQPAGAGEVQTDHELPSVQFGANGLPTPASYAALIQAVAQYENVSPDTVGIDYFKTTDAETTNLDQYIQQRQDASDAGKAPNYCFIGSSCRDYALGGMVAGGAVDAWRTPFMSVVPNTLLNQLSGLADQYVPDATKATVTASECDTLPDGTQRCQ